jgi:hypothetical protein
VAALSVASATAKLFMTTTSEVISALSDFKSRLAVIQDAELYEFSQQVFDLLL